jgi:putative nucleotidyltransferase with HDIG domain
MVPTRYDAWQLLTEFVASESLRKHCLCVEAAMRVMAHKYGGDEERWGMAGLLHDFDYERYPSLHEHAVRGAAILKERGYPDEVVRAILSHNDATGVPREHVIEKALAAVDELSGFVLACAYVRPSRFKGMTAQSVEKNLKKKGFAGKIHREDIERGIRELGADRTTHIELVIGALRGISRELGW